MITVEIEYKTLLKALSNIVEENIRLKQLIVKALNEISWDNIETHLLIEMKEAVL